MLRVSILAIALLFTSGNLASAGWWSSAPPDPVVEKAWDLSSAADAGDYDKAANIIRGFGFCNVGKLEKALLVTYGSGTTIGFNHIAVEYLPDGSIKATYWHGMAAQLVSLPVVTVPLAVADCSAKDK